MKKQFDGIGRTTWNQIVLPRSDPGQTTVAATTSSTRLTPEITADAPTPPPDVAPSHVEDGRVVRVRGKALPDGEQRFPAFETRREKVDGVHFFPVHTYADDVLRFPSRRVRMRMTVRYSDYRRFMGKRRTEWEAGGEGRVRSLLSAWWGRALKSSPADSEAARPR